MQVEALGDEADGPTRIETEEERKTIMTKEERAAARAAMTPAQKIERAKAKAQRLAERAEQVEAWLLKRHPKESASPTSEQKPVPQAQAIDPATKQPLFSYGKYRFTHPYGRRASDWTPEQMEETEQEREQQLERDRAFKESAWPETICVVRTIHETFYHTDDVEEARALATAKCHKYRGRSVVSVEKQQRVDYFAAAGAEKEQP